MKRQFGRRVLWVLGIAVACHGGPFPAPNTDEPRPEGVSGSVEPGDSNNGGDTKLEQSGGRDGRDAPPSSAPTAGAAGDQGANVVAGSGSALPEPGPFEGPPRCTSQAVRDPNETVGPEMNPGFPCIACHAASNAASGEADAPIFAFAGTLYPSAHEPNSCRGTGAEGAEVVINDAAGSEFHALANTSGNFLLKDAAVQAPFSVKVLFEGRQRAPDSLHEHVDCNTCHSELGSQGAPGRVVMP